MSRPTAAWWARWSSRCAGTSPTRPRRRSAAAIPAFLAPRRPVPARPRRPAARKQGSARAGPARPAAPAGSASRTASCGPPQPVQPPGPGAGPAWPAPARAGAAWACTGAACMDAACTGAACTGAACAGTGWAGSDGWRAGAACTAGVDAADVSRLAGRKNGWNLRDSGRRRSPATGTVDSNAAMGEGTQISADRPPRGTAPQPDPDPVPGRQAAHHEQAHPPRHAHVDHRRVVQPPVRRRPVPPPRCPGPRR